MRNNFHFFQFRPDSAEPPSFAAIFNGARHEFSRADALIARIVCLPPIMTERAAMPGKTGISFIFQAQTGKIRLAVAEIRLNWGF
jgi:hypothetical protein